MHAPWSQLPDVNAAQVQASLTLKKFFTGDLEAPVTGYPPFDGLEKHLLRVQIARISADTVIAPAGLFEPDDAVEDEGEVEDWTATHTNLKKAVADALGGGKATAARQGEDEATATCRW